MQYQILHTNITRTIWQTVRRITNEILGVNGLIDRVLSRILYSRCFGSYRRNPNIHALWACNLGP